MTTESDVVVVNFWGNGFGMRVQIALEEKGVTKYEYKEMDLTAIQYSKKPAGSGNEPGSKILAHLDPSRKTRLRICQHT